MDDFLDQLKVFGILIGILWGMALLIFAFLKEFAWIADGDPKAAIPLIVIFGGMWVVFLVFDIRYIYLKVRETHKAKKFVKEYEKEHKSELEEYKNEKKAIDRGRVQEIESGTGSVGV